MAEQSGQNVGTVSVRMVAVADRNSFVQAMREGRAAAESAVRGGGGAAAGAPTVSPLANSAASALFGVGFPAMPGMATSAPFVAPRISPIAGAAVIPPGFGASPGPNGRGAPVPQPTPSSGQASSAGLLGGSFTSVYLNTLFSGAEIANVRLSMEQGRANAMLARSPIDVQRSLAEGRMGATRFPLGSLVGLGMDVLGLPGPANTFRDLKMAEDTITTGRGLRDAARQRVMNEAVRATQAAYGINDPMRELELRRRGVESKFGEADARLDSKIQDLVGVLGARHPDNFVRGPDSVFVRIKGDHLLTGTKRAERQAELDSLHKDKADLLQNVAGERAVIDAMEGAVRGDVASSIAGMRLGTEGTRAALRRQFLDADLLAADRRAGVVSRNPDGSPKFAGADRIPFSQRDEWTREKRESLQVERDLIKQRHHDDKAEAMRSFQGDIDSNNLIASGRSLSAQALQQTNRYREAFIDAQGQPDLQALIQQAANTNLMAFEKLITSNIRPLAVEAAETDLSGMQGGPGESMDDLVKALRENTAAIKNWSAIVQ